jgi:hypothetical protein
MKYQVRLFPPQSKKLAKKGTFILSIEDKGKIVENSITLEGKEGYLEFEVPDDVEYRYNRYSNGRTFEPRLVYKDGRETEIVRPVPERL